MSFRFNFLNWRPDLEDVGNEGLTVADNCVHEPEGYKAIHLGSAGSFGTTGGLAASNATVLSVIAKPVGNNDDLFCGWIANSTLHVGINGVTAASTTTGYPLSFATAVASGEITVFDVCEAYNKIFFTVQADGIATTPATTLSLAVMGYMDYD